MLARSIFSDVGLLRYLLWTFFSKRRSDLYRSLDNVSRGVFRTHSNIYGEAFLQKILLGLLLTILTKLLHHRCFTGYPVISSGIQFTIRFTKALWSSNKTVEVEYGPIIKAL